MDIPFPTGSACRAVHEVGDLPAGIRFWQLPAALAADGDLFLLDSALPGGRLGRWSFAGGEPLACLAGRRRRDGRAGAGLDLELLVHREPDGSRPAAPRRLAWTGDPYEALRALRAAYAPGAGIPGADAPFAGGLVGWLGYEVAWADERLPQRGPALPDGAPDLFFMACDDVLRHDHASGVTTLVASGRGPDADAAAQDLSTRLAAWRERLGSLRAGPPPADQALSPPGADLAVAPELAGVSAASDEATYRAAVEACRERIRRGDAFEICLTQQLEAPLQATPWQLYAALRAVNPAPFAAFIRAGGVAVAGASPERFLAAGADGRLESRPIKGTRPRGATPAADQRLRRELAESEKDNAENTMIVDLVRNDLGRVARVGSVAVPELRVVESYATVHQLVSTVTAELKPGRDALDAVRACFPGGSMTGAPKLEAMSIIEALEAGPRGVYSGALGWLGWDGALDLSIVIRTFVCSKGRATFGTGGAVTADSDPGAEYRETLDKARALLVALRRAGAEAGKGQS